MDVDEEEEEEDEPEPQGSDDDTEMADGDASSSKPKGKKHKKRRKSELDMAALGDEQAAVAALESTELMKLRLTKKYCAEALNFVKQLDGAMSTLSDLLGSKSKPEVLEAIEFFRVAHEYKLEGSDVSNNSLRSTTNAYVTTGWHSQDAASHMVKGRECNVRGWERAQGSPPGPVGLLQQPLLRAAPRS
jgi:hypothetical protein